MSKQNTSTNPYFDIKPILESTKLIDVVFKRAMKASSTGNVGVTPVTKTRRTEAKRVLTCAKLFRDRMNEIVLLFPNFDEIPKFYIDTIDILIGIDKLKQMLGSLSGTSKVIWRIYREQTTKIWHSNVYEAKRARRSAFSRFASVINKLKSRFIILEELRKNLRKLPVFDFDSPIFVISGYPNVGKSSFLRSLTNARPEVADYPFTTKKVSIGHYVDQKSPTIHWQLVDTPGILDRGIDQRNEIEKKTFAAIMNLPSFLLFLFDPMQVNKINQQLRLFEELKQHVKVPILFIINKIDKISSENLESSYELLENNLKLKRGDIITLQANNKEQSIKTIKKIIEKKISSVL